MTRAAGIAIVAACQVGLAACGGSGGSGYASPGDAVRAFQTAIKKHDSGTACGALTDSLKNAMIPGKVHTLSWKTCDDLARLTFSHNAGVLLKEATIGSATVTGDHASVPIKMKFNIDNNPSAARVLLIHESGGWQIDDLCAFGACFKRIFISRHGSF